MTRVVMAIVASSVLMAVAPTAQATTRVTDPVARPSTVYPYVRGGRPDAAVITFHWVPRPTLSVYDLADDILFRAPVRNGYVWDPRVDGDVLGTRLTGDEGEVFRVCVNRRGSYATGSRYCTKVRLVHVRKDGEIARERLGRVFDSKTVVSGTGLGTAGRKLEDAGGKPTLGEFVKEGDTVSVTYHEDGSAKTASQVRIVKKKI